VNRRGYTLIELVVASFLISLLSMLLILAWKTFGLPALEVETRARITIDANLAAESLARDLSGYQVKREGKSGPADPIQVYRLYKFESRLDPDDTHPYPLRLRFKREDQATNPTVITVSYYVNSSTSTLVRTEEESGTPITVATHVKNLEFTQSNQISFTVSYRQFEGTYTLDVDYPS
jgi:prepilin-type N-terminal cleavage/methylation domain-containing protein